MMIVANHRLRHGFLPRSGLCAHDPLRPASIVPHGPGLKPSLGALAQADMPMMIPMNRPVRIARIMITKSLTSVVNVKATVAVPRKPPRAGGDSDATKSPAGSLRRG